MMIMIHDAASRMRYVQTRSNKHQTPIVEDVTRDPRHAPNGFIGLPCIPGFSEANDLQVNEACHHGSWHWRSNQDESLQEYAPDEQKELQDKASACIGHMLCNESPFLVRKLNGVPPFIACNFYGNLSLAFLFAGALSTRCELGKYEGKSSML